MTGFYTVLDDNLGMPFQTVVLGVDVTVAGIDLTDDEQIMAVCMRGSTAQRIPIVDLALPTPQPDGAEWIAAYRRCKNGVNAVDGPCTMLTGTGCG